MLRQMMWEPQAQDKRFIAMMHDFVESHMHMNASTESFKSVVEKHMTPLMDVDKNHRMDWFFSEWVYGTDVPRYKFDYTVEPDQGKFRLKANLTQSEVSDRFAMVVPIYGDFDGRIARIGQVTMAGNSTIPDMTVLLPSKPRRVMINAFHDVLEQK